METKCPMSTFDTHLGISLLLLIHPIDAYFSNGYLNPVLPCIPGIPLVSIVHAYPLITSKSFLLPHSS